MLSFLGEHFPQLVVIFMALFAAVLFLTSVEDAVKARSAQRKG